MENSQPIKDKRNRFANLLLLAMIWLAGAIGDRLWFALDRNVPGWDQAEYLTGALDYWQALKNPQWFSGEWWTSFWLLSSKTPPLTYIATVPFLNLFGKSADSAAIVHQLFSAILLGSVCGLGIELFSLRVGLRAAGLCVLLPGLYRFRQDFLLDYPLTAIVTLSFWCLTVWKLKGEGQKAKETEKKRYLLPSEWLRAAAFGLSLGLALLVKQTAVFFLFVPVLWVGVEVISKRAWGRLAQLVSALLLSVAVFGPWYRTNWLLILTSGKRATVDSALAEGDPGLNTLAAWTYYWKLLPKLISWPLLLVPIVGLLLYWRRSSLVGQKQRTIDKEGATTQHSLNWLFVFLVGAYLLCSLNINKDERYILPCLPALSLLLACGLTCSYAVRWGKQIRICTVGLAIMLMFLNMFPFGETILQQLPDSNMRHPVYLAAEWPHQQAIAEIIKTEPYLRSTLGVLPSTERLNQHNFNYYGALQNFQVYGRQVGVRRKQVPADARSLSWFVTKTGEQGFAPKEAQAAIVQIVEQGSDFELHKTWDLHDRSILKLYHSRVPPVQVRSGDRDRPSSAGGVELKRVIVPERAAAGTPVPITYEWSGSWDELRSGLVLLTWRSDNSKSRWLHDRGVGMGALVDGVSPPPPAAEFQVIERLAMLPGADVAPGTYTLQATYLNRKTGETYPIAVPPVTLKIDPTSPATAAPELDLITQMRTLATGLPKGRDGLTPIFEEVGRINQYDPIQDYLVQAQQTLEYRLQQEPQNVEWAYALALSQVLQRDVSGAIAALERVTRLDAQNPYAHAYLAFVHLYDWHPKAAQIALKPAETLNPNLPELKALNGLAALMQGNLVQAWQIFQQVTETHRAQSN